METGTRDVEDGSRAIRYRIEGMDCAGCARRLEAALSRLPGIRHANVSFAAGTLHLVVAKGCSAEQAVEDSIRKFGMVPAPLPAAPEAPAGGRPWWRTGKAMTVLGVGLMMAAAAVTSHAMPEISGWAYLAAAAGGLVPFARRAVALARAGSPFSIETLMSVAVLGALAIGAASEAAMVVLLFAIGELLENAAAGSARAGIRALADLIPRTALVEENDTTVETPAAMLRVGQTVLVRPGDRVPADGVIAEGHSQLDEAPVTGESVPVDKKPGDAVFAGSINRSGAIRVRVDRAAADNTIARIIHLVEEAQAGKAPIARFIDRFSAWYTPAAMAAAALVMAVPPLLAGADWNDWIYRGLSILLIACPCALVLSTPAAIASGIAAGARHGLLIKGGAALEAIGRTGIVAFDKTGTLTVGHPAVTDVVALEGTEAAVLSRAAGVESGSAHPLAQAIVEAARSRPMAIPPAREAKAMPGRGASAIVDGEWLAVVSPRHAVELGLMARETSARARTLEEDGKTVVVLVARDRTLGLIALRDEARGDARAGLAALKRLGIRSIMLTGDNRRTGEAIARTLGIEARAELTPEQKLAEVARLKADAPVAMVGDGINDAPALASASVGIAMGGGTDVALETADAALLRDRVTGVAELVALSRATLANIRENVAVALGLKAVFLIAALLGVTSLWMAILADTGATVIVTLNALRLLRFKPASALAIQT